jgi:hypothetical protein
VLAVAIACVVHVRHMQRAANQPTTSTSRLNIEPSVAAPAEPSGLDVAETVAPSPSAPTSVMPLRYRPVPRKGKHTTKPQATYDPSSI